MRSGRAQSGAVPPESSGRDARHATASPGDHDGDYRSAIAFCRSAGSVDLVVAATAELQGLTLLYRDRDFECIAAVTGQAPVVRPRCRQMSQGRVSAAPRKSRP
jgi:hypothetical protein